MVPASNKNLQYNFKDPYLLDFLNLGNGYLEKDLEQVILYELEKFILELGKGFTFVKRQKRMIIDGEDFNLDLLFYHRKLKRLVAIELKLGKFQAKHKGQIELLEMHKDGIIVAEYWTDLPPKKQFEEKIERKYLSE